MRDKIEQAVRAAARDLFGAEVSAELSRPDGQFGDFTTNLALRLSKQAGQNPRDIAQQLADRLKTDLADDIAKVNIAGPGFINLTLNDEALIGGLQDQPAQTNAEQVVIAEYSDPNPFKPLHAGHLYTTLVGDVMSRLLEVSGAQVTRINYGGDVGLHVGKSMWAIVKALGDELPEKLSEVPEAERPQWLGQCYVEGNNAYEEDEAAKAEIIDVNRHVYQLHDSSDHDSPFAQIYWTCRDWSYEYFKQLYDQLQVHQFDRVIPESEVTPLGLKTVREHVGDVYQESDGAIVFKGEDYGLHTRVFINSQGLPTYEAKDVGLLFTKWQDYHYDRSIYITANEQAQYMQVMFKSVEQFAPEPAQKCEHLTHGLVKLQGGVKMSSRKGNIVSALDILEAASQANKQATGQENQATVLGAVKYAFLKNRIGGDIAYDPVESVSLEGNSGPYLQYAHARACSILRKAPQPGNYIGLLKRRQDVIQRLALTFRRDTAGFESAERTLVLKLTEYAEVVDKAVAELMPHHITSYLYELAQTFNRFYEHNRVLGDSREEIRVSLVALYAETLGTGLQLLGITAPEQM